MRTAMILAAAMLLSSPAVVDQVIGQQFSEFARHADGIAPLQ